MTMSKDKRGSGAAASFRISPVAIGCTLLIVAAGAAAQTQQLETVTVTGIRKGIEDAISVKRNSDSIVEAISAEDIGKLPDTSIAESIARLPGVAAQRVNGRATSISVRGFSPDFATSLLNGREQVSTGDSRYVEYDQYPSELLSGVTIYKTPDAGLIGQGLSGTINMESARPLNFGSRVVAVNYRDVKLGKGLSTPAGKGSRVNLAYIDQFADRTIGVAIGYARLKENTGTTQNSGSWGVADVCPVPQVNGACPQATVKAPGGFNDLVDNTDQKRDAVMATLQYKPNKNFNSTLDVFATKFDQTKLEQGVQMPLAFGQGYMGDLSVGTVANGVATTGSIAGYKGLSRNDVDANHDKVHSIGWNNQLVMGDWTGALDLATSEAKRKAPHLETTAGVPGNCKTNPALCGTLNWSGFDGTSVLGAKYTLPYDLGDASKMKLTDVEGWGGGNPILPQAGYSKVANTDDKLNAFRLSGKRSLGDGMFSDLDVGVNYADRKKVRTYVEGRLRVGAETDPFAGVPVAASRCAATSACKSSTPTRAPRPSTPTAPRPARATSATWGPTPPARPTTTCCPA
ncbi:MAG: TonB-dependent receptor plug domain-containing protein [Burkholderiales bacterium]|nr:TonB-dependent receptor plug domain-containing protein [Burkholderiales bacterium]